MKETVGNIMFDHAPKKDNIFDRKTPLVQIDLQNKIIALEQRMFACDIRQARHSLVKC